MPSPKMLGNRGSYLTGVGGIGASTYPDGSIGWVGIVGKAGEIIYLGASEVHSLDKVQVGYFFQSPAGAKIDFTLANIGLAKNPDPAVQVGVPWGNTLTVPAGATIVTTPTPLAFAAIRVTFTGDGELYIVTR